MSILVYVIVTAFIIYIVLRKMVSLICLKRSTKVAKRIIEEHVETLSRTRRQKTVPDKYGSVDYTNWSKEIDYFINRVVLPHISNKERLTDTDRYKLYSRISSLVDSVVDQYDDAAGIATFGPIPRDPLQFEEHCARLLIGSGWEANLTAATGDKGADIIARKDNVCVAIQCKQQATNIGIRAVQEVNTARILYGAQYAAVVGTRGFTRNATEAAKATGVLLLHVDELTSALEKLLADHSDIAGRPDPSSHCGNRAAARPRRGQIHPSPSQ
jgi:restriction system protein